MRVANADTTGLYEDLMQSWARVNDGHYDYLTTQAGMDRAFDRASTLLRQPAAYKLEVDAKFERDPGPGKLQVVSGDENLGGAVALILDASGSMLKRMEGGRRIEIAKNLLAKAVTEHIPPGTPVALRVFGHKEANSCRTDLVVPMKPLDPAAVAKTLDGINAKNLAKTPIADSLAKIESDLKGAKGKRVVVLVTDGEETCDGDPAAVLQKLADRGIDLRLEIVGFAIADDDLKQQFEGWAEQGGGRYFDAGDAASLERSLAEALQIPYSVFDQNGSLVAKGTVDGEPIPLEAGTYRVTIATSPPKTIEQVEVPGGQRVVLKAGGS
jgi:Mg-chelatase subunit ChlD